jgi:hypothetical protein
MSSGTGPGTGDLGATTPARSYGTTGHESHGHETHGRRLATETKAAYKTTEFVAFIAVVAGILISASSITGGGSHVDLFKASQAWLYVSIVTLGYMISRGIAKSGSKQPYDENH